MSANAFHPFREKLNQALVLESVLFLNAPMAEAPGREDPDRARKKQGQTYRPGASHECAYVRWREIHSENLVELFVHPASSPTPFRRIRLGAASFDPVFSVDLRSYACIPAVSLRPKKTPEAYFPEEYTYFMTCSCFWFTDGQSPSVHVHQ